jgi:hypothetical protein
MRNLIILLVLVCGLVIVPNFGFTQNMEYSDLYITPETNPAFFGGYLGGDGNTASGYNDWIDWGIGNGVPFNSYGLHDIVFSTNVGNFMNPADWIERMRITKYGSVSIGVTNPQHKLEVMSDKGYYARIGSPWEAIFGESSDGRGVVGRTDSGEGVMGIHMDSGNYGKLGTESEGVYGYESVNGNYGKLGTESDGVYGYSGHSSGDGVFGFSLYGHGVHGSSGNGYAGYFIGDVHVLGDLSAIGTKPFIQPHAENPSKEIVYVAAEAPEVVVILRGTAQLKDGKATIEHPKHFRIVAAEEGVQVQVTPRSADTYGLAVTEQSRERIVVEELMNGKGNFKFNYYVTAIRSGFEDHQPVVANTHFKPENNETAQEFEKRFSKDNMTTKAMRSMLISNGILTEDGKLNMTMVEKFGWKVAEEKTYPDNELGARLKQE